MLRLRTTTALSMLALLAGVAGTGWLSGMTSRWSEPSARLAMTDRMDAAPRTAAKVRRSHAPVMVVRQSTRARSHATVDDHVAGAPTSSIALQPLAMPADTSRSWAQLRGHLDGRVVVHLRIDGVGQVQSATLVASSGDPVLDRHALSSVRGWRFAVPAGHPDGVSGELPMLFSSQGRRVGML